MSDYSDVMQVLQTRFGELTVTPQATCDGIPTLWVAKEHIRGVLRYLKEEVTPPYRMLYDLCGIDERLRANRRDQPASDFTIDRERIFAIVEAVCGGRMHPNWFRIGGVAQDLPQGWDQMVGDFVRYFPGRLAEYDKLVMRNRLFKAHRRGWRLPPRRSHRVGRDRAEPACTAAWAAISFPASATAYCGALSTVITARSTAISCATVAALAMALSIATDACATPCCAAGRVRLLSR